MRIIRLRMRLNPTYGWLPSGRRLAFTETPEHGGVLIFRVSDHEHQQLILDTFRGNLIGVTALGVSDADGTFVALTCPDRRTSVAVGDLVQELDGSVRHMNVTVS